MQIEVVAVRSLVVAAGVVTAAGNAGSMTSGTHAATLSCSSEASSREPTLVTRKAPAADHAGASPYARSSLLRLSDTGKAF